MYKNDKSDGWFEPYEERIWCVISFHKMQLLSHFKIFFKKLLDTCLPNNTMFWPFNFCPFCPWEGRKVLIVGLSDFVCFFSKVFLKGIPLCRTLFLSFYSSDKTFYHVVFQNFSKRQTAGPDFRFKSSLFLLKIHVHGFLFSFSIFRKIFWFCCCLFTK